MCKICFLQRALLNEAPKCEGNTDLRDHLEAITQTYPPRFIGPLPSCLSKGASRYDAWEIFRFLDPLPLSIFG